MASELMVKEPKRTSLGTFVKLLGIFLVTFLLVFVLGWIWDIFAEQAQRTVLRSSPQAAQTALTVDPNIEKELANALATDENVSDANLKDPFSDRSNLSNATAARYSAIPSRDQLTTQTSANGSGQASRNNSSGGTSGAAASEKEKKIDIAKETREAMLRRQSRLRSGIDPGPESAIFFIDDLLPVGMVSGGNKAPEVLLYSITLQKTFSFPAGATFRDGWLATWRSDGVAFGDATRNGAIFLKPWTSAINGSGEDTKVVIDSAEKGGSSE